VIWHRKLFSKYSRWCVVVVLAAPVAAMFVAGFVIAALVCGFLWGWSACKHFGDDD